MASFTLKTLYSLAFAFLLAFANGASLNSRSVSNSTKVSVIDFKVDRSNRNASIKSTELRRDGAHPASLVGRGDVTYLIDVGVGTPPQQLSVTLDTGSSDLWVADVSSPGNSLGAGTYNPTQSSTYQYYASGFYIGYGDKTHAGGDWAKDEVQVGDTSVNLLFGDATSSTVRGAGILGIGLVQNEAPLQIDGWSYPNFPKRLKEQGFIDKIAYSIYLGSLEEQRGTIIFGGIDNAKYQGQLVKIANNAQDPAELSVDLNSVELDGLSFDIGDNAVLDTGTSLTFLPPDVANQITNHYFSNYYPDSFSGGYYSPGPCPQSDGIKFNFNGISIQVPPNDVLSYNADRDVCELYVIGQTPNEDGSIPPSILGDTFLRSAYLYYDLEGKTTSLAQVKYTSESNIVAV